MPTVFDKLNWKGQSPVVVIDAPASFAPELAALRGPTIVRADVAGAAKAMPAGDVPFFLAFVTKRNDIDALAKVVAKRTRGDAVVWFAYPKGTSKRYTCDFNRDTGWAALGEAGFEGVRQVAIDEDWSALRFRRVEYIASFTRDPKRAMTKAGKARVTDRTSTAKSKPASKPKSDRTGGRK